MKIDTLMEYLFSCAKFFHLLGDNDVYGFQSGHFKAPLVSLAVGGHCRPGRTGAPAGCYNVDPVVGTLITD